MYCTTSNFRSALQVVVLAPASQPYRMAFRNRRRAVLSLETPRMTVKIELGRRGGWSGRTGLTKTADDQQRRLEG